MAFTRDWVNTNPLDHTKFNDIAGQVRNIRGDLEDRLASILSGFTSGETSYGIKLARLLTVGTGNASQPTGTGAAASIDMYVKTVGTGQEVCLINGNGTVLQMTTQGGAGLNAVQLSSDQTVAGVKTMTSHIIAPDTNPSNALEYASKGYVDIGVSTKAGTGSNSDITELTGLTVPIGTGQGGTGATLFQRGSTSLTIGANTTITFPVAFANTNYTVVGMVLETTAEGTIFHIVSKATTGFVVWNTAGSALAFEWIAIGNA